MPAVWARAWPTVGTPWGNGEDGPGNCIGSWAGIPSRRTSAAVEALKQERARRLRRKKREEAKQRRTEIMKAELANPEFEAQVEKLFEKCLREIRRAAKNRCSGCSTLPTR